MKKVTLLILVVVIMLTMLRLGVWQLDRAEQKRAKLVTIQKSAILAPVDLAGLLASNIEDAGSEELRQYRKVELNGQYIESASVLIDNQVVNSQPGYWLLTPFSIEGTEQAILVNRGWLPMGSRRDVLPEYETPAQQITLQGRLNILPIKPVFWKDNYAVNLDKVWQFLPLDEYQRQYEFQVLPMLLELDPKLEAVGGYLRLWPDIKDEWVMKHQGYAFQWFAMAVVFLILVIVLVVREFVIKKK